MAWERLGLCALTCAACTAIAGCGELEPITAGVCGNGFVEPEAGEDCDGASPALACRQPGEPFECRFDCSGGAACPNGLGCGSDGVCRAASGRFSSVPSETVAAALSGVVVTDLDADGRKDVVATSGDRVIAHYFSNQATLSDALEVFLRRPDPEDAVGGVLPIAVGELSGDALPDVLAPHLLGMVMALGTSEREERVTAHTSLVIPPVVTEARVLLGELVPPAGDEIVLFGRISQSSALLYFDISSGTQATAQILLASLPGQPGQMIEPALSAQLDASPDSPCDELVIAFEGGAEVVVFSPCRPGPNGPELNLNGSANLVKLPGGRVATRAATLADLNGDAKLDLIVGAASGNSYAITVGYGVGDGSFHSSAPAPTASGDNTLSVLRSLGPEPALAFGFIDTNDLLDWVVPSGVLLGTGSGQALAYQTSGAPLSHAFIGPFNATGGNDVVAVSVGEPSIVFLNASASGVLTETRVPTDGAVASAAVGDFDGDQLVDLAVSHASGEVSQMYSVAYGEPTGALTPPVDVGLLDPVEQITIGRAGLDGVVDGTDEMVVMVKPPDGLRSATLIAGTSTRRMRSPFAITKISTTGVTVAYTPTRAAIGRFDEGDHGDLAVLTRLIGEADEFHLVLVPVEGEGRVTASAVVAPSKPLDAAADWRRAALASLDLGGDGLDDVVLFAPTPDGSAGFLQIGRPTLASAGRWVFELDALEPIATAVCHDPSELEPCGVVVLDADADGAPDVAAIGRGPGGESELSIWFSDAGGLSPPVTLAGAAPAALASISAGARERLAILEAGAVRFVSVAADRTLTLDPEPALAGMIAARIAAGDLDADGIADLVAWDAGGAAVYRGLGQHD